MDDEELLTKYKSYIKKRNMIIIVFLIFLLFLGLMFLSSISKKESENSTDNHEEKNSNEIVDKAPILKLNEESISIMVNDSIDYKKYIDEATDDVDGIITEKVQFSKIDTSKVGEYEVLFFVFDTANNVSKKILKVTIKEPPKLEETTEDKTEQVPQENSNSNQTTPPKEESSSQNKSKPSPKYYLFTDGYTMNNVVESCAKELKEYGGAGRCEPITDENGIYLGMKLVYE